MTVAAEGRVERQKLNQTTALQGAQNKNKIMSENFQTAPDQNFGSKFSLGRWLLTLPHPTLPFKHVLK